MKPLTLIRKLRGDQRGFTFLEVMTTFTMVSIASVCTVYSLFFASGTLKEDMHRQQVARMVQEEVEYWIGRIYLADQDFPNEQEMTGSGNQPYRMATLDPDATEPITVRFFYDPIVGRGTYKKSSSDPPIKAYYVLTVWAEWQEPHGKWHNTNQGNAVSITTYVVPGGVAG